MLSSPSNIVDLLIVGGGINGTGIAADAAGRGLSVVLCEQNDLASATSSASSKLIHGGLRYLEHYEFRLVREALAEREVLLRNAPHLVRPLRFTLPHRPHLRPAWMLRSGLFLYDHLSRRTTLPAARSVHFGAESPLRPEIKRGFEYSDCWVDDARLVVVNALAAQRQGAEVLTRHQCIKAVQDPVRQLWDVTLLDRNTQRTRQVWARALVNAAGPWVTQLLEDTLALKSPHQIRLIKGSHILVRRFHEYPGAFILQNQDRRIVFVLPFQGDFHLIGTTDKEFQGDPAQVQIDADEIQYLLDVVNEHFTHKLTTEDIVGHYSGVRPLSDDESTDPSAITRDYRIELMEPVYGLPLLSVFGGKITTYRKLAEAALAKLVPYFPHMGPAWTAHSPLPGALSPGQGIPQIRQLITSTYPWLPSELTERYCQSYGTLCLSFLQQANTLEDLGQHFGAGLYQREVDYLRDVEWAVTAEDILWRRTKLGLQLQPPEQEELERYLTKEKQREQVSA